MSENFFKREFIPPEEKNLHKFKGSNFKEVIDFLEGEEDNEKQYTGEKEWKEYLEKNNHSIFDGFLDLLRDKGLRISTPEWLQFLRLIKEKVTAENLKKIVETDEFLNKVRLFAQTTLVKNKSDELAFHNAFDEYFELAVKVYGRELEKDNEKNKIEEQESSDAEPEIKDQLGIDKVDENLIFPEGKEHDDNENIHGGQDDQHNDILRKKDLTKKGGGDNNKKSENNNKINSKRIVYKGKRLTKCSLNNRKKEIKKFDKQIRDKVRPDKASVREIRRSLCKIITRVSESMGNKVNLKSTVKNFARHNFHFDYKQEKEKQHEIVLLIDVGGPVDEWSPLIENITKEMTKGLSKLEIYLFHNNLYGYVWKPNSKKISDTNYANPNSLIDLKKIIKKRKNIIIYGDAEMSSFELKEDKWPPKDNDKKRKKFTMSGIKSLNFIKRKADSVVWINPIFAREWQKRDNSGTINAISDIIPMYDLTVGGVRGAINELIKK